MSDQQVLQAIQKGVMAAVAAAPNPVPVKYVGRNFTIPNDQKWLEVVWLPNNETDAFWGEEVNYRGSLRMLLHWPVDDAGAYLPITYLEAVTAYFTKDRWLDGVQITAPPALAGAIEAGTDMIFPATVRYQRFAA